MPWIKTAEEFISGGYDWGEVIEVGVEELDLYYQESYQKQCQPYLLLNQELVDM